MRSMVLVAACFSLVLVGCEGRGKIPPLAEWQDFTSKDGTIQARFPGKPKVQDVSAPSPAGKIVIRMVTFESPSDGAAFSVGKVKYPFKPSQYSVTNGLEGAVKGAVSNVKGRLISEKDIELVGMRGKEVVIEARQNVRIRARFFIDKNGPTMYQSQVVGKDGFVDGEEAKEFFESFEVTLP